MSNVLGVLGPIVFEVDGDAFVRTWQDAKRDETARWATHDVFAGPPKKEFIGPGLAKINLTVRLDRDRGLVPRDELRRMREQMRTGAILPFTVGGKPAGNFNIENVSEQWKFFGPGGVLLRALVELTLGEYA